MDCGFPSYSVLMTVYEKDNPKYLSEAIESMLFQTYKPAEFVVVVDGNIPETLLSVLLKFESENIGLFKFIQLESNVGLGAALSIGVEACKCDLVARMDADDLSDNKRCETIIEFMISNPMISMVGCNCIEISCDTKKPISIVNLPTNPEEVKIFAKKRVPIRHPSIIFKKNDVLRVGNYKPLRRSQEYDLVVRMLLANMKISNVPQLLFSIRVGDGFYSRRGGWDKAILLTKQRYSFFQYGFYNIFEFLFYAYINASMCLIPNSLRAFIYRRFLRMKVIEGE